MPLQPQYVEVPLIKGIDLKTDSKQVPLGKLLAAENVIFQKPGKVQKRNGFSSLGRGILGDGQLTDGQAIAAYKNELLAFDKTNIYSYIEGVDAWNDKGDYVSTYLTSKNVSNSTNRDFSNDSARHGSGLECYVFNRQNGNSGTYQIYYTVMDGISGQTIVAPTLITSDGIRPKVVAFKNTFVIFYYNTNDTRLYRGVLPIGSIKQAVTFNYISGDSADENSVQDSIYPAYYAASITTKSLGEQLYLIFNNRKAAGGSTIRRYSSPSQATPAAQFDVEQITHTATIFHDQYFDAPVFAFGDGVGGGTSTIWVYIYDPALLDANNDPVVLWWSTTYNTTIDTFFPAPAIHITGVSKSATELKIDLYFDIASTAAYVYLASFTEASAGGIGPFAFANKNQDFNWNQSTPNNDYALKIPNIALASQAFTYGGKSYVAVVGGLGSVATGLSYYIINELGQTVAKYYAGLAPGVYQDSSTSPYSWWLPSTNIVSDTQFLISAVTINGFGKVGTNKTTGISSIVVDFFNEEKSYSRAEIGDNLFIGGGLLFNYDGVSLVEAGFNYPPEIGAINTTHNGTGSYQYKAVYEWIDQQGNLNYSAPSPAITRKVGYEVGVSGTVNTAYLKTLTLTEKTEADGRSPVIIALYRTTLNGTTFYRLPVTTTNQNDPAVPAIAVTDNTTDSDLIGGTQLYTDGGALEADQAPPVGALAIYRNRLFVLDSTNPLVIYYSKEVTTGNPVEFNLAETINVDPTGGPCTALASMDDKLIIFKESSIRYIAGNGPDANGDNSDYGNTVLITTDAGCTNQRSIVNTPEGLIFKSKKGIYLINRGLQVSYIGAPVEDYNDRFITSAVLLENKNQVRFTLDNTVALVYDYFVGAWAVFTNVNAVDSIIWNTKHTYLRTNGQPLIEADGVYTDDGSPINLKIQTTWLNFAGIQGFQRFWAGFILGTWKSPHRLLVDLNYDFNESYYQRIIVTPEPLYTYGTGVYGVSGSVYGGVNELYQYRINPERQKCMTVKMTISDIPDVSGSFGAGPEISNLRFEYGVQVNGNRLRTKNQFG